MRVFVAGATGAIGRPLVRQLVEAGHAVTGMTRSEQRAAQIAAAGGEPVVCDAFDAERLREVVTAARPEAVVHELTALPPRLDRSGEALGPTNRLRVEGTRNLLAAAGAAGARRLIAESIAFTYVPEGGWVKREEDATVSGGPGGWGEAMRAVADLERQVAEAQGIEGIVLRYGWLYGPGTYLASGGSLRGDALRRRLPLVGRGDGRFSFVHVEDAASATVAAVERGAPGVYNVVDDEPAPMRDWVPVFADAVGAKPPRRLPVWLARLVAGAGTTENATQMRGASNEKAKRELGWQPRYASWRQGFREALD